MSVTLVTVLLLSQSLLMSSLGWNHWTREAENAVEQSRPALELRALPLYTGTFGFCYLRFSFLTDGKNKKGKGSISHRIRIKIASPRGQVLTRCPNTAQRRCSRNHSYLVLLVVM